MIWNVDDCMFFFFLFFCALAPPFPVTDFKNKQDNKPKSWPAVAPWAERLSEWIHMLSARDGNKRFLDLAWQDIFATQTTQERFSTPLGEGCVKWTQWLSEEALWARIGTLSHVAMLQGAEKEEGLRLFREVLGGEGTVRNEKGEIECHGWTYFAWTERL